MIAIKRAYDPPSDDDGIRILVDRLWPRGISKERAKIDRWEKEIAPSNELRKWFHHEQQNWAEFEKRYKEELKSHTSQLEELAKMARTHKVTLVYGAKDEVHNQAQVLKDLITKI